MAYRRTPGNGRGETLVETLVALLISAISLIMFADMLAPAVRLTETGRSWNADVNLLNTLLEERNAGDGVRAEPGTVSIKTESGESLINDGDSVTLYIARYGGEQVISYGTP